MALSFADKLERAQATNGTSVALLMRPKLSLLPLPMQRYDDPFLPFGKAIIDGTRGAVCAYVFDFAAYLALGAAGAVALERTIAYAGTGHDVITILHAPFASTDYAEATSDKAFNVDAVTVVDEQYLEAYTVNPANGAFVVKRGEHPVIIPLPGYAGAFWQDVGLFTLVTPLARTLNIHLAGEKALYAGRGDDFPERVRAALEGWET